MARKTQGGRPAGSYSPGATDAAARAGRLRRDGFGDRAAARIVAAAEAAALPFPRNEDWVPLDERRQRQRLRDATKRGWLENPRALQNALVEANRTCTCDRWPFDRPGGAVPEHSHCAACGECIGVGDLVCPDDYDTDGTIKQSCYRRLYWGSDAAAKAAAAAAEQEGRDRRIRFSCGTCAQQGKKTPVKNFKNLVSHYHDVHRAHGLAEATRWACYDLARDACMTVGIWTGRWQDMWRRSGIDDDLVAKMTKALVDDEPWTLLGQGRRPGPWTAWEHLRRSVPRPKPARRVARTR